MARKGETGGRASPNRVALEEREAFAQSLEQRRRAARGLEKDLLTDVPLLYGSPGAGEPDGDPGIALAQAHREELVRRNGGGVLHASGTRSEVSLPFERTMGLLAIVILLVFVFGN